jgi:copper(I)-binding protein
MLTRQTRTIAILWGRSMLLVFLLAAVLALLPALASAHDYHIGSIHIDHPWAIATPNGAKVGGGYMKITNEGTQPDRLIALTSPSARKVVLHGSVKDGDVVKMRALDKGIEIKPGETVDLSPEGTHIMFEGLRSPLIEASRVQGTLVFEKAGKIDVDYAIEPMGTKAAPPAMVNHQH